MGSNRNDILTRWVASGVMETSEVHPTISPSMDIQVSSNVERLLFELFGRDGVAVAELMSQFRDTGRVDVGAERLAAIAEVFDARQLRRRRHPRRDPAHLRVDGCPDRPAHRRRVGGGT